LVGYIFIENMNLTCTTALKTFVAFYQRSLLYFPFRYYFWERYNTRSFLMWRVFISSIIIFWQNFKPY